VILKLHLPSITSLLLGFTLLSGPLSAGDWQQVIDVSPDDVLNIRQAPDFRSAKVGELPHDAKCVQTHGCSEGWCRIALESDYGWVRDLFLQPMTASCLADTLVQADDSSVSDDSAAPALLADDNLSMTNNDAAPILLTDASNKAPDNGIAATNTRTSTAPSSAANLLIGATELLCNNYLLLSPDPVAAFVESASLLFDEFESVTADNSQIGMPLVSIQALTAHGVFYADYFGTATVQTQAGSIRCSGSLLTTQPEQQQQLASLMLYPSAAERLSMVSSKQLTAEDASLSDDPSEQLAGYARYFGQDCDNISVKTTQVQLDDGSQLTTLTYALRGSLPPPLASCAQ